MADENRQEAIITLVERQKRNNHRYNIHVDDRFAFSVHEDLLIKYRLLKGERIDPERMETITLEDERHRAYLDAIRLIGVRQRSRKETADRLSRKGYDEDTVKLTLEKLEREKALDDESFARMWADNRIRLQRKGRHWIRQELAQKGVPKEVVAETIARIDPEDEYESALQIGAKKWPSLRGEPRETAHKLAAFLLRRGYSGAAVQRVVKHVSNESVEELDS